VPIAIGGVGGSGTRLVAGLLRTLGVFIGDDLNVANDNLWFTLLFKRPGVLAVDEAEFDALLGALVAGLRGGAPLAEDVAARVFELAIADRPNHPAARLRASAQSLLAAANRPPTAGRWGWKEPNTHLLIERIWQRLPTLRYVHVVRNGIDMAYGRNQNQLKLWGKQVLGEDGPVTPARSLAYWCHVHQRMQALLAANPRRMYWLDYDALCSDPGRHLAPLLAFLAFDPALAASIDLGIEAIQRRRDPTTPLDAFDPRDLAFAHSLGYG
jgi:hypothetical protein